MAGDVPNPLLAGLFSPMKCCVPHCNYEPTERFVDAAGTAHEVREPHLSHAAEYVGCESPPSGDV